jgi:hypothetical protein
MGTKHSVIDSPNYVGYKLDIQSPWNTKLIVSVRNADESESADLSTWAAKEANKHDVFSKLTGLNDTQLAKEYFLPIF